MMRLSWPVLNILAKITCGIFVASFVAFQAQGQENLKSVSAAKEKYGDWEMHCETPPGASKEQCALLQSVTAEDKPNVSLTVIVLKLADNKGYLMRVVAPLGVLIPSGLELKVDQTNFGRAGFVRCMLTTGCVAEIVMDDKLIEQLKVGQTATFIIYHTPEEGTGIPFALEGFKRGFEKLP